MNGIGKQSVDVDSSNKVSSAIGRRVFSFLANSNLVMIVSWSV